jgi:hypothetical protein
VATNRSERKWNGLLADLELVDPTGNTVGRAPVMIENLHRKQSKLFDTSVQWTDGKQREFSGYRMVYKTGSIAVKYVLTMVSPVRSRILQYSDPDLWFSFSISESSIELKMKNNSRSEVKVIWSDAEFTDVFEQTHLVTHFGGGNSTIYPGLVLAETVEPVSFASGEYGGWRADRILPRTQDAGEIAGRTIALSLPVQVEGIQRMYLFKFQVAEVLF